MTSNEHYYSQNPTAAHKYKTLQITLRGKDYTFLTDAGVFSKDRVDRGTRLLIQHMEIAKGDTVLDLGCGYGPLGIVAADLAYEGRVYLVDINERAVELSKENLSLNGIHNAEVLQSNGFSAIDKMRFDVIISNPPIRAGKATIYQLMEDSLAHLKEGGRLYVVARTKQGARSLSKEIERLFGNVQEVGKGGGYRVIRALRQTSLTFS